jgi:hypothetical protein
MVGRLFRKVNYTLGFPLDLLESISARIAPPTPPRLPSSLEGLSLGCITTRLFAGADNFKPAHKGWTSVLYNLAVLFPIFL